MNRKTKGIQTAMKIFRLFLLIVLLFSPLKAATISVSQSLTPTAIEFDEQTQFEIVLTWDGPPDRYYFPNPLKPEFVKLIGGEVSSSISSTGTGSAEISKKVYRYTLSPSLSGSGRVESVTIDYIQRADTVAGQLMTSSMVVSIASPKAKPKADSETSLDSILLYVGFSLVIIGALLWFLLIYRKQDSQPKKLSQKDQFIADIHIVRKEAGDDLKKFQTSLHPILSQYLIRKFDLQNVSGSTDALIAELIKTNLTKAQNDQLTIWLVAAEKAKFMPLASAPGDTIRLESEIIDFFEKQMIQYKSEM